MDLDHRRAPRPYRAHFLSATLSSASASPPALPPETGALLERLTGAAIGSEAAWTEALTHGSFGANSGASGDYQRLEFLGDRVLGLVIAEWLYETESDNEGRLSQRLNVLVSRQMCAEIARGVGLGPHIRLGKQARDDGGVDSDNILGDVMEALIGACFVLRGFEATRAMVRSCRALYGGGGHPWRGRGRGHRHFQAGGGNRRCRAIPPALRISTMSSSLEDRCGVVAVLGAPNAGKSTLVNALVGQKVAIVSAKAQTTRARLMGIALEQSDKANAQIILADTPGIFAPRRRLDRAMVAAAWEGAVEADAILLVVDAAKKRREYLPPILEVLKGRKERKLLVLNKVDLCVKERLLELAQELTQAVDFAEVYFVSAGTGDGVPQLKAHLASLMPVSAWHFPEDQVSDASERLLAAEITREQLYRQLHEELPYDSTVRPESYTVRKDGSVEVHQQIVIARDSQKPIVLGKQGARIKAIGEASRKELAGILGVPVHLFLHVKVDEKWADAREIYEEIGLEWVK